MRSLYTFCQKWAHQNSGKSNFSSDLTHSPSQRVNFKFNFPSPPPQWASRSTVVLIGQCLEFYDLAIALLMDYRGPISAV